MGKLFGTDGIRGRANDYPMTAEMAVRVGRSVTAILKGPGAHPKIIVGRDTRISGDMLEAAVVAGVCSAGGNALLAGVIPTPGIAFLTSSLGAAAGIVVSASHNPYHDNGIKIFNRDGFKLSDATETEIERRILADDIASRSQDVPETGTTHSIEDALRRYKAFLKGALPDKRPLSGLNVVLDCANGATCRVAPEVFVELGAEINCIGIQPDGTNINDRCGSEHPQDLIASVLESQADVGLAFDGDGDRLIAVDETGAILSGDNILAICAKAMHQKGTLRNNIVVSTVMSNMGLGAALKQMGIAHKRSAVGDRQVMQKMVATGAVLGGEDSGHMIFGDCHTTGDGILTALRLLEAMQSEGRVLSDLKRIMKTFPQVLINVAVREKPEIEKIPEIVAAIQSVEAQLGKRGRVLVRYSGTQPLCRVMVEGPVEAETKRYCKQLSELINNKIGLIRDFPEF